ncbi:MAG TPA: trypsin-like serine protease [Mycobacteriales bacterium]|jgi:streptogrisin C
MFRPLSRARRKVRWIGAALLAAAALNAAASGTTATAAADPSAAKPAMPEEVLAEYREMFPDVPLDALYRRLNLAAPRKRLLERFGVENPTTFAGSFYDYRTGVWHVLATTPAAAESFAARARAIGVDTRPRVVRYSAAQLTARAARIRAGQDPMSAVSRAAGVDLMTNSVTVAAPVARRTRRDTMVRYVDPAPAAGPDDACSDRRDCGAPLRTGVIIWKGSYGSPKCSLGYAASATDGSRWALTAGHCIGAINETWGHGEQYFGAVRQCGLPSSDTTGVPCLKSTDVDVARVKISNPYWLAGGFGYVFYSPSSPVNLSYAILSRYTIEVNDVVCIQGWHRNYTGFPSDATYGYGIVSSDPCGGISETSSPSHYGMPVVTRASACSGDSGGAWLYLTSDDKRWAYGVHKNGYKDGTDICGDGSGAWFSSVPAINEFFDANSAADIRIVYR